MLIKPNLRYNFLALLKGDRLEVFALIDDTKESRAVLEAKDLLLVLLKNGSETSRKALKYYEALNLNEDQINALNDDFLTTKTDEGILEELKNLFPRFFVVAPIPDAWAWTTYNGEIILKKKLIKEAKDTSEGVIELMFTLWHELAHKKKKLHLGQNKDDF